MLRPALTETTAFGAAGLAGLASGLWSGADELSSLWRLQRRFEPQWGESARRAKLARWREAVVRSRRWAKA